MTSPMLDVGTRVGRLAQVIDRLSDRERQILVERTLGSSKPTLENLGRQFGVTRERIRQVERRMEQRLRRTQLGDPWRLGERLYVVGEALRALGLADVPVAEVLADPPQTRNGIAVATYLYLCGARISSGYIGSEETWSRFRGDLRQIAGGSGDTLRSLRRRVERELGEISSPEFAALLDAEGVPALLPDARKTAGNNLHRVAAAFTDSGAPLSKAELSARTGLTGRQVDSVLNHNEFEWVGRRVFAPTSWGLPVYRGTESALDDEIRSRGGRCPISEAVSAVVARFGCTETSCLIYIGQSPRFVQEGDWVALRESESLSTNFGLPARQRSVYDDGAGGLCWAVDVDRDVLRGSGHHVPSSVAAILGVTSERPAWIELPGGRVQVSYSGILTVTGSLRPLAFATQARLGDRILMRLHNSADVGVDIARGGQRGLVTALEFVGRTPSNDPIAELAAACWQSDSSLLREALWDRREGVLLRLVGLPERDPRGRDLDLSLLDELLGAVQLSRRQLGIASGIGAQKLVRSPQQNVARLRSAEMTLLIRHLARTTGLAATEVSSRLVGVGELPALVERQRIDARSSSARS